MTRTVTLSDGTVLSVPRTRSRHPYLLVRRESIVAPDQARIVGYAASTGPAVQARARRLSARIVPNPYL